MNKTKRIVQCAETKGWKVHTYKNKKAHTVFFEISKFTPAGQDFNFFATMKGNNLDTLVADIEEYYECFDVDAETYLWLDDNGHGRNGAPYRMRDVLEDMEAAEKMIEELLEAVRNIA